jgi:D-proline reductase (dithiol) PrdB
MSGTPHFDAAAAHADINVVYPIDRLKELVAQGLIGRVASRAVSVMGFSNMFGMRDEVVPAVVAAVRPTGLAGRPRTSPTVFHTPGSKS